MFTCSTLVRIIILNLSRVVAVVECECKIEVLKEMDERHIVKVQQFLDDASITLSYQFQLEVCLCVLALRENTKMHICNKK